jgi:dihydropyrimidinase
VPVLIRGGRVVDVDGDRIADVRVAGDGTIAAVGPELPVEPREDVVDANGKLVIPGGVDAHTHLRLRLGAVEVADDVGSGTAAAAIGGTTTVLECVTPRPQQPVDAALAEWRSAASAAAVDHGFHLAVLDAIDEPAVDAAMEGGITSFTASMAGVHGPAVDDGALLDLLRATGARGGLVAVHAENGPAIRSLQRRAVDEGRRSPYDHARTRPPLLEGESTARAAMLAEMAGARMHLVQLSSAPGLEAARAAQERGVDLTAETCPHYLHLTDDRLRRSDAEAYVCTPPLREPWHAEELWYGLAAGWVHMVASDHSPWTVADRRRGTAARADGWADFREIPGGLPGIETRMALVWSGVVDGRLRAGDWVRLCCETPARRFGLWPRKGNLRPGADADVVVWDPLRDQCLDHGALHMRVDHSPYAGMVTHGWPDLVLLRGEPVARGGAFVGRAGGGRYLARDPVTTS